MTLAPVSPRLPSIVDVIEKQEAVGRTVIEGAGSEEQLERAFLELCRLDDLASAELHLQTSAGQASSMHAAAARGHVLLVKWLHETKGVPLTCKEGKLGWQPIHRASIYGHLALIQYLHKQGVKLNSENDAFDTPLTLSRRLNHPAVATWLEAELTKHGASLQSSRFLSTSIGKAPPLSAADMDRARLGGRAAALVRRDRGVARH